MGCVVVDLDQTIPFTAARARNAGLQRLLELNPTQEYVQFLDGDCEIQPDWLATARGFLDAHSDVAAVYGRRRERFPDKTVYNQLCDWEWEITAGPAKYCGGDVMMRVSALSEVGGYRDTLIAGEEPELCVRLRAAGWQIHALQEEMTLHDAAMTRFGQWWKRMKRSGYAYAAGSWLHGRGPERHWIRQTLRPWIWVPLPIAVSVALCLAFGPAGLLVLGLYPLQVARLILSGHGPWRDRFTEAFFNTLARFPELFGQLQFLRDLLPGKTQIIEYK